MAAFKLAVVGTYSSGKTTLVDGLLEHHSGMRLMPEHARRTITVCGIEEITRIETRDYLIVANLLDEAEADKQSEPAISDSGLINNLAHEALFFNPPPDRARLLTSYQHRMYDAVFLCDHAGVELVDDGQRMPNNDLRLRLHHLVVDVLVRMKIAPILLTGDPQVRLSAALKTVSELRKSRL